jgi:TM2 domain-containing membrane protein YozV
MRYCTKCGGQNDDLAQYCSTCQAPLGAAPAADYQPGYQPMQSVNQGQLTDWQKQGADKKLAAGLCGILLGGFGVHKFILGYTTEGIIEIVITLVTCGLGHFIGLIEGIIYLTKSDEEFVRTYVQGRKGWF